MDVPTSSRQASPPPHPAPADDLRLSRPPSENTSPPATHHARAVLRRHSVTEKGHSRERKLDASRTPDTRHIFWRHERRRNSLSRAHTKQRNAVSDRAESTPRFSRFSLSLSLSQEAPACADSRRDLRRLQQQVHTASRRREPCGGVTQQAKHAARADDRRRLDCDRNERGRRPQGCERAFAAFMSYLECLHTARSAACVAYLVGAPNFGRNSARKRGGDSFSDSLRNG